MEGIEIRGLRYNSAALQMLRRDTCAQPKVAIRFDASCVDSVEVQHPRTSLGFTVPCVLAPGTAEALLELRRTYRAHRDAMAANIKQSEGAR